MSPKGGYLNWIIYEIQACFLCKILTTPYRNEWGEKSVAKVFFTLSTTFPLLEIDHCRPNPCQHGGDCIETENGFKCHCQAQYQGLRCEGEGKTYYHSCYFIQRFNWPRDHYVTANNCLRIIVCSCALRCEVVLLRIILLVRSWVTCSAHV